MTSNKSKLVALANSDCSYFFTVKLGCESDEHEGGEVGSAIVTTV